MEERGTGLRKKFIYNLKWVEFLFKTVYIEKQEYDNETTHILLVKIAKTLIYEIYRGDPFKR